MQNKIFFYNNKYFLIMSVLILKNKVNILGFSSPDKKVWSKHVESINLTTEEFSSLVFD